MSLQDEALAAREQVFTDYVRSLDSSADPPAAERVEAVLCSLRKALKSEIRKRGLWDRPPSYLGIYGLTSWAEADWASPFQSCSRSEAWELVVECCRYVFLDRYEYLARQLKAKPNIEGLVYRNVRNFLHDTQKKHDPLGFRVFVMVQAAVLEAVKEGELFVLEGDSRIRNDTLLGFDEAAAPEAVDGEELEEIARAWNDVLLPDLITAWGRLQAGVLATLRSLLARLPTWRFPRKRPAAP